MKIKKVLVSQPKPASEKSPYYDIAQKYGVKIDFRPFIKVESVSAKEFRQQKVSILDYTAVIFTSRHAIDHFFHLCTELRVTIPETMKYFCVTEAVMYRTVSNDFTSEEEFDYDMLVFFSPAGVTSLKKNFPDFQQKEIKIGTFGSTTAQAVRDAGLRLDLEAPSVQAPSMTAALDMFIKENNKGK